MSNKQPKALTLDEQKEIERNRRLNDVGFKEDADKKNSSRSVSDKLRGKNKVSALDMAHEEALKDDVIFEEGKKEEEEELAQFTSEMELAKQGIWRSGESRFGWPRTSAQRERKEELDRINNENLAEISRNEESVREKEKEVQFVSEMKLAQEGGWQKEYSKFLSDWSGREYKELETKQASRIEARNKLFEEKFKDETNMINRGEWDAGASFFQKPKGDFENSYNVQSVTESMLTRLNKYETQIISEEEKKRVAEEYNKEVELIESGQWVKEQSYFHKIQQEPRYQKFDDKLKSDILEKLIDLSYFTFTQANNETEKSKSRGKDIAEAVDILNLKPGATLEDAQKAYKVFMQQNHPDRKTIDEKTKKDLARLTNVFPVLKEYLKNKNLD